MSVKELVAFHGSSHWRNATAAGEWLNASARYAFVIVADRRSVVNPTIVGPPGSST